MNIKMILTNGFDPDPRVLKEAVSLKSKGHDIEILCWDRENKYINIECETYKDIKIKRFFSKSKYGSGIKQMWSYLRFIKEVKRYLKNKEINIIHGHDIDGALVGAIIKANNKLIWDMHEFFDGFNYSFFKKIIYIISARYIFYKCDALIYVVSSQKERYSRMINSDVEEILVMNCPDKDLFNPFNRNTKDILRVSFIGSVRETRTLKIMIEAAEKLDGVIFYIHGTGIAYDEIYEYSKKYKNTVVTGRYNYNEIVNLYENTDIVYSVYDSTLLNVKEAFPVKGFEAIVTDTPIIASKDTYFGDFIRKNDIGYVVDEKNEKELIDVILAIQNDQKRWLKKAKNMKKIKDSYYWEHQASNLLNIYDKLTLY